MDIALPDSVKTYANFFHPLLMWALFALTLYAGYLGVQSRRVRSADKETRKELVKEKFADRHYKYGSIILALMVAGSVGGMAVTYINNGKLFVGPHLLAGLGMTVAIALSASLAPAMRQGNDAARYGHIAMNSVVVGLFGWQAISGMQIVQKILDNL